MKDESKAAEADTIPMVSEATTPKNASQKETTREMIIEENKSAAALSQTMKDSSKQG